MVNLFKVDLIPLTTSKSSLRLLATLGQLLLSVLRVLASTCVVVLLPRLPRLLELTLLSRAGRSSWLLVSSVSLSLLKAASEAPAEEPKSVEGASLCSSMQNEEEEDEEEEEPELQSRDRAGCRDCCCRLQPSLSLLATSLHSCASKNSKVSQDERGEKNTAASSSQTVGDLITIDFCSLTLRWIERLAKTGEWQNMVAGGFTIGRIGRDS
mmetsp:Transcript_83002/g.173775  ORF Transcript_83002/g.173775 Transcript_83002/m.173775 type:complete len:211 (+) Transcript_83002:2123-2755(+)